MKYPPPSSDNSVPVYRHARNLEIETQRINPLADRLIKRSARFSIQHRAKLGAILDAKNQRINTRHLKRIEMRDHSRVFIKLLAERTEGGSLCVIAMVGIISCEKPVKGSGKCARLHRANAHHTDIIVLRGADDVARLRRFVIPAHAAC